MLRAYTTATPSCLLPYAKSPHAPRHEQQHVYTLSIRSNVDAGRCCRKIPPASFIITAFIIDLPSAYLFLHYFAQALSRNG